MSRASLEAVVRPPTFLSLELPSPQRFVLCALCTPVHAALWQLLSLPAILGSRACLFVRWSMERNLVSAKDEMKSHPAFP